MLKRSWLGQEYGSSNSCHRHHCHEKNNTFVNLTFPATITGLTANTTYLFQLVAAQGCATTIIDAGSQLTADMNGTVNYSYMNNTTLQFSTTYTFTLNVFNKGDNTKTAKPLATNSKSQKTCPNAIGCCCTVSYLRSGCPDREDGE